MRYEIDVPIPMKMSLNDRPNRWQKARQTRALRELAGWKARALKIGPQVERIDVGLTWVVLDKRRRDPSNIIPTQKALLDGLVDAGVIPDDTPRYVREAMPEIIHSDMHRSYAETLTFWVQTFDQYGED